MIHTLTLSYLAFFLGSVLEFKRISQDWGKVFKCLSISVPVSLLVFLFHSKNQPYSFQGNLDLWPIFFSFIFIGSATLMYAKELTVKLGEGTTMLHSLVILYYFIERGYYLPSIIVCLVPTGFSVYHALSYRELTHRSRLLLSLWSSAVMIFFAGVYMISVFQTPGIEKSIAENMFAEATLSAFRYFFMGASGIYIFHNVLMLLPYLPGRTELFLPEYRERLRRLNETHIERYSHGQVERKISLFILALVGALLSANFYTKLIAPVFLVWICFVLIPPVIGWFERNK